MTMTIHIILQQDKILCRRGVERALTKQKSNENGCALVTRWPKLKTSRCSTDKIGACAGKVHAKTIIPGRFRNTNTKSKILLSLPNRYAHYLQIILLPSLK
uniref:Uncharacterized protein n=1 Tax=Proboscia inermis TaxID=420281 RepID=A0A7S0GFZ2_9STRA|mmetsp:Transcript_44880/g.45306  ORF Transcript_44880/g.45306 Transcript_44880/m.45306 type:complete len:101 (+) Transcript_44880:288-590(+)